eukprot:6233978-Karenia_brevis.AAC.1
MRGGPFRIPPAQRIAQPAVQPFVPEEACVRTAIVAESCTPHEEKRLKASQMFRVCHILWLAIRLVDDLMFAPDEVGE